VVDHHHPREIPQATSCVASAKRILLEILLPAQAPDPTEGVAPVRQVLLEQRAASPCQTPSRSRILIRRLFGVVFDMECYLLAAECWGASITPQTSGVNYPRCQGGTAEHLISSFAGQGIPLVAQEHTRQDQTCSGTRLWLMFLRTDSTDWHWPSNGGSWNLDTMWTHSWLTCPKSRCLRLPMYHCLRRTFKVSVLFAAVTSETTAGRGRL
jgi:hypothetical protein